MPQRPSRVEALEVVSEAPHARLPGLCVEKDQRDQESAEHEEQAHA
jgi:hypothetical protein